MGRDQGRNTKKSIWPHISAKKGMPSKIQKLYSADRIIVIPDCLTEEECKGVIDGAETIGFQHQSSRGPAYGEAFRDNHRIQLTDPTLAFTLWDRCGLRDVVSTIEDKAIGLNDNIRIYRYSELQRFGKHIDEANDVKGGCTKYTLLIYLSDCVGGETIFYGNKRKVIASVQPKRGMALLHLHGDNCLEHEGAAVKKGVKYVLRSDVVVSGSRFDNYL